MSAARQRSAKIVVAERSGVLYGPTIAKNARIVRGRGGSTKIDAHPVGATGGSSYVASEHDEGDDAAAEPSIGTTLSGSAERLRGLAVKARSPAVQWDYRELARLIHDVGVFGLAGIA